MRCSSYRGGGKTFFTYPLYLALNNRTSAAAPCLHDHQATEILADVCVAEHHTALCSAIEMLSQQIRVSCLHRTATVVKAGANMATCCDRTHLHRAVRCTNVTYVMKAMANQRCCRTPQEEQQETLPVTAATAADTQRW
jgi:hypothetical protein